MSGGGKQVSLNQQQYKFCEAYLSCENGTEAAIQAGYAPAAAHVQSSRLLKSDKVKTYLEKVRRESAELARIDESFILRGIAKECSDESPAIRLKALELLGRAKGLFTADQSAKGGQQISFSLDLTGKRPGIEGEVVELENAE